MILDQHTQFVIYGAGEVGINCCNSLVSSGYTVVAGLDKKKRGVGILPNVVTYGLEDNIGYDKSDVCVIICLANGLIHKDVAYSLYEAGYSHIVFLPINFCVSDCDKNQLTAQYNRILDANMCVDEEILAFEKYTRPDLSAEQSILKVLDNEYVVLCPLEMLFSESMELWTGDMTKIHTSDIYKDRPIASSNPCKALFDYIGGLCEDAEYYFASKKDSLSHEQKIKQIKERSKLYSVYEHEYNKKSDFFIEGAPRAVWNPKNYWNLIGGHHRTLYLLHKGQTFFPIKVKKTDFDKWINADKQKKLGEYLHDNKIESLWAPVPNPGFVNFPAKHEKMSSTILEKILSDIEPQEMKNSKVLDMLEDEGYFARVFSRIGAEASFYNENTEEQALASLCSGVLYQSIKIDSYIEDKAFKLVFCEEKNLHKALSAIAYDGVIYSFDEYNIGDERNTPKNSNEIYRGMQSGIVTIVRKVIKNV